MMYLLLVNDVLSVYYFAHHSLPTRTPTPQKKGMATGPQHHSDQYGSPGSLDRDGGRSTVGRGGKPLVGGDIAAPRKRIICRVDDTPVFARECLVVKAGVVCVLSVRSMKCQTAADGEAEFHITLFDTGHPLSQLSHETKCFRCTRSYDLYYYLHTPWCVDHLWELWHVPQPPKTLQSPRRGSSDMEAIDID